MTSTASRSEHLDELLRLLWPEPLHEVITQRDGRTNGRAPAQSFIVIPSFAAPRLLVPATPRVADSAVRNLRQAPGRRAQLRRTVLAAALRARIAHRVFRDRVDVYDRTGVGGDSLQSVFDEALGEVTQWSMPVSRARANRKPVLQLLNAGGTPIAYVKVGTNALTRELVRGESEALNMLSGRLRHTAVPEVLAATRWHSLELLLLRPLPVHRADGNVSPERMNVAVREVAASHGLRRARLVDSLYWKGLGQRLGTRSDSRSQRLHSVWNRLADRWASVYVTFGSWHGDWAPWNMASTGGRLLVWDFERFSTNVPVGFDLAHFDLQTRILDPSRDTAAVIAGRLRAARSTLAPHQIDDVEAPVVFIAYLMEVAARWIADGQASSDNWASVLDGMVSAAEAVANQDVGRARGAGDP